MTGQLKAASGTLALPGITFGADSDTGFYRKSANTIGVVAGGAEIGTISSAGITGGTYFPAGTIMVFHQTAAPTGWTKVTDSFYNNKAFRSVTGSVANGGSTGFTSVFASRTITQANLPNVSLLSSSLSASSSTAVSISGGTVGGTSATTTLRNDGSANGVQGSGNISASATTTTTISGSVPLGGSGTAMDFAVAYLDIILATKD